MLRTDDSVRRVRAMWLGSGALRWPWDWTYVEWGLAAGCGAVAIPVVGLFAGLVLGPAAGIALGVLGGAMIAHEAFQTLRLAVDFDRPVRWWRVMVPHELQAGRPARNDVQRMTLVATWSAPAGGDRQEELSRRLTDRWHGRAARRELAEGIRVQLRETSS